MAINVNGIQSYHMSSDMDQINTTSYLSQLALGSLDNSSFDVSRLAEQYRPSLDMMDLSESSDLSPTNSHTLTEANQSIAKEVELSESELYNKHRLTCNSDVDFKIASHNARIEREKSRV